MSTNEAQGFDALLEELDTLQKASTTENSLGDVSVGHKAKDGKGKVILKAGDASDEKVEGAAADGDTSDAVEGEEGDEGSEAGEKFGKSFTLKLEDGSEVEAIDGADLIKSLVGRIETNESQVSKALGSLVSLFKSQVAQIETLQGKVDSLSSQGRGRKAVLTVSEKMTPLAKSARAAEQVPGVSADEFMAKALLAQVAGALTGQDIAITENRINHGAQPHPHVIEAVRPFLNA